MSDPEVLIAEMMAALQLDGGWSRRFRKGEDELIAEARRCGRVAGRRMGRLVRTFAVTPDRLPGVVSVLVELVRGEATPDELEHQNSVAIAIWQDYHRRRTQET